ncbi:MAG: HEAT repeat domain-containing protein [Sedimentisphaerales bacterium]|nr:HEAT repeat domain-containing protein [Sedimentisphaerales bacterium]
MSNGEEKFKARQFSRRRTLCATDAAGVMPTPPPSSSVGQIIRLLNNVDPLIREGAIKSLTRIRGKDAEGAVIASLTDLDEKVRAAACRGVGHMRIYEEKEPLINFLQNDPSDLVRIAAAAGLGMLGDRRGLKIILKFAHPRHSLKWEALRSINMITKQSFPANLDGLAKAVSWVRKKGRKLLK